MFAVFGIATVVALVFGAGAATAHVAENGAHIDIPAIVSK